MVLNQCNNEKLLRRRVKCFITNFSTPNISSTGRHFQLLCSVVLFRLQAAVIFARTLKGLSDFRVTVSFETCLHSYLLNEIPNSSASISAFI